MTLKNFIEDIQKMKSTGAGLMSLNQYASIGYAISMKTPCNLLVFGLGEESKHWHNLNKDGKTVFIEDNINWISKFKDENLTIQECIYTTLAEDHELIGFDKNKLDLLLPDSITGEDWDIIIVDAPLGHGPPGRPYKGPGRMQSIFSAYQLLKKGGICIVDDMKRTIESKYSLHFFGEENLLNLIEGKVAIFKKP